MSATPWSEIAGAHAGSASGAVDGRVDHMAGSEVALERHRID
jgi:hypothetical protein